MTDPKFTSATSAQDGWWTRDHALIVVLVVATALLIYLCALLAAPFFGPLSWAIAFAIVAHPMHCWLKRRIPHETIAAGIATAIVAAMIIGPGWFVANSLVREASSAVQKFNATAQSGDWRKTVEQSPPLAAALRTAETQVNLEEQLQGAAAGVASRLAKVVTGSAWVLVGLALTLFFLFFLFRDRELALRALRGLVPLSDPEASKVFARVSETVFATLYGSLVVALVQGTLGGLMFALLGLPAPILWGAVMSLLAVVPVLGTFVIWAPAAIFLALSGQWGKAIILVSWGALAIGTIDNFLYPYLVGNRLRLHTVPVFMSVVGGLAVFGAAGVVLGPVILALTDAIIEVWRRRTAHGEPAEAETEKDRG